MSYQSADFTGEETEVWRREVACLRSRREAVAEQGLETWLPALYPELSALTEGMEARMVT